MDIEKLIKQIESDPLYFHHIKDRYKDDKWLYNILLNTYEYKTKPTIITSMPIDVFLPLVAYCNAHCLFCKYCNDYKYYLPVENLYFFKDIIKFVKNFGFNCYGEPLLHPDFDSITYEIKKLLDPRATTYLVTNGILLQKRMDSVKKYCDSINISLNAATPETHAKLMRVNKSYFYNIIEAIKELVFYKNKYKSNFMIQISFCVTTLNFEEIPEFIKLCNKLQVDRICLYPLNLATIRELEISKKTDYNTYKKLSLINVSDKNIFESVIKAIKESNTEVVYSIKGWQESSIVEEIKIKNFELKKYYCSYLYQRMLIDVDLENNFFSRLCCFLESPKIGFRNYLKEGDIRNILNHKEIVTWREKFIYNPPDICKKCLYLNKNLYS